MERTLLIYVIVWKTSAVFELFSTIN